MAKINVSTPRTALLLLIMIVGFGLILSLIRMSEVPNGSAYYTSSRQYISHMLDEAAAQRNTDPLHIDDGPTRFEDDSIIKLYQEDQQNHPDISEPSIEPSTDTVLDQSSEPPSDEQNLKLPTNEPSPAQPNHMKSSEPPTDKQSSELPTAEQPKIEPSTDEQIQSELDVPPTEQGSDAPDSSTGPNSSSSSHASTSSSKVNKSTAPPTVAPSGTDTDESQTEIEVKRTSPVHVLLLTEGRSGSTWLSSFFWHRQEVYYVFEPLFQTNLWKSHGCSTTEDKRKQCDEEIMSHMWKCDFHSSELSVLGRYPDYHLGCKETHSCSQQRREGLCNAATHRVAKTIRLWDLTHLENVMKNTLQYDVRVIHLVRDPRPLLQSRSKPGFGSLDGVHRRNDFTEEQSFEEQSATVCKRMLEIAKLGDNPPDWLKDRYVRITHEHMSLHPIETAKMLYEFVNLPWTKESEDFIYNTTTGGIGRTGMFGIGKVSTEVINKWKMMKEGTIEEITRACYDAIQYLGYETDLEKIRQWKLDNADLFADEESATGYNDSDNNSDEAR